MKANMVDRETWDARSNEKANVFMYFGKDKVMPSDRELFCEMLVFGQVVSVKVIAEKGIAFCQFYKSEDAANACSAPHFGGVTAEIKSAPKKKQWHKEADKKSSPQKKKKEDKLHVFDLFDDAIKVTPKRMKNAEANQKSSTNKKKKKGKPHAMNIFSGAYNVAPKKRNKIQRQSSINAAS
jgi:hypothetical protein